MPKVRQSFCCACSMTRWRAGMDFAQCFAAAAICAMRLMSELLVDQINQGDEVGHLGELLYDGPVFVQRISHFLQVVFRSEQQRVRSKCREIRLVEEVGEDVRMRSSLAARRSTNWRLLSVPALHDHRHFFRPREIPFEYSGRFGVGSIFHRSGGRGSCPASGLVRHKTHRLKTAESGDKQNHFGMVANGLGQPSQEPRKHGIGKYTHLNANPATQSGAWCIPPGFRGAQTAIRAYSRLKPQFWRLPLQ